MVGLITLPSDVIDRIACLSSPVQEYMLLMFCFYLINFQNINKLKLKCVLRVLHITAKLVLDVLRKTFTKNGKTLRSPKIICSVLTSPLNQIKITPTTHWILHASQQIFINSNIGHQFKSFYISRKKICFAIFMIFGISAISGINSCGNFRATFNRC